MTPFKIKQSPVYRIELAIPGIGRLSRISTGTKDKKVAEQMENALLLLANTGHRDLIEQLRDGHVSLREVWTAHTTVKGRDDALRALAERRGDPLLSEVVPVRKKATKDERVASGYDQLLKLAPKDARVSWLTNPTNITDLYELALETRKPNSVRRSLHRAVCDLLARRMTRGRMLGIMADVIVPSENDERLVELSPPEITSLLDACDEEFRNAVGFAMTSGIDRTPMLTLRVDSLDEKGIITVRDTKAAARNRRMELDPDALRFFNLAAVGKKPGDRVFPYTNWQLRDFWEAARKAIGRKDLRWKDLRGVYATYFLAAGGSPRDLQQRLGHSTMAMTLRYIKRLPSAASASVGDSMGLTKANLKVERGGA